MNGELSDILYIYIHLCRKGKGDKEQDKKDRRFSFFLLLASIRVSLEKEI